jgi:hypothetical protein
MSEITADNKPLFVVFERKIKSAEIVSKIDDSTKRVIIRNVSKRSDKRTRKIKLHEGLQNEHQTFRKNSKDIEYLCKTLQDTYKQEDLIT